MVAPPSATARRRRKRDERRRPTQRAVTPAGGGASFSARPRRRHLRHASPRGPVVDVTLAEAAERVGVTPATLRRWARGGLIPQYDGEWTPSAIGHARVVARMRERGHSLAEIQRATEEGRLAFGFLEDLFPSDQERVTIARGGPRRPGSSRRWSSGWSTGWGSAPSTRRRCPRTSCSCCATWRRCSTPGFPLVALLQLVRVYGQAMAQVADAEVRLFHLYVHEPLMRSGSTGVETAEQMLALSREVLPLAGPVLDQVHQRYLQHFIEQDVVGHMEADLSGSSIDLGRMRVAIAFADLAGYTRLTEEEGELTARRRRRAVRRGGRDHAARRGAGDQDDRRRGDDRRLRPGGADRLGGRLPAAARRAAAAADRDPLRRRPVPRRRLLRARRQHRLAGGRALGRRRGAGHPAGGRARPPARTSSSSGSPRSSSRASPSRPRSSSRASARRSDESTSSRRCARTGCWRRDGRSWCCSPAGATRPACSTWPSASPAPSGAGAARQLRAARRRRRRRAPLPRSSASGSGSRSRSAGRARPAGPATCRPGRATSATAPPPSWRSARGADVAAGHTATDQVETILYRLASSPSRRALLGMRPRDGLLVRPLLRFTREQTAALLPAARAALARGREQRRRTPTPATGSATSWSRRSRPPTRRRRPTCWRWPRSCATRPRCSTSSSIASLGGRARDRARAAARAAAGAAPAGRPAAGRRGRRRAGRRGGAPGRRGRGAAATPGRRRWTCRTASGRPPRDGRRCGSGARRIARHARP